MGTILTSSHFRAFGVAVVGLITQCQSHCADINYSWSIDWTDGVAPGASFAQDYSPSYPQGFNFDPYYQKTAVGSVGIGAGFDGNGALVAPAVPPGWPSGYSSSGGEVAYSLYFKDAVFDLTQPGSSVRLTAYAAQTGTDAGGEMFIGLDTFNPWHTADGPVGFGVNFGPGDALADSSAPLVWYPYTQGTGSLSPSSASNLILRDANWVRIDIAIAYDAATQEFIYTLYPWSVYDDQGLLVDADLLPAAWSNVEYRQTTSYTVQQLQNTRAYFTGTATYGPDATTQNSSPVWDDISIQYVVTVPESGSSALIVLAFGLGFSRRRRNHKA